MTPGPRDPVAAVTHDNPYPYYDELVARAPLARDEALGVWVAAGARAVDAVLSSDRCATRPANEPVPQDLTGSPAGSLFGGFARMRDGAGHAAARRATVAMVERLDPAALELDAERQVGELLDAGRARLDAERITEAVLRVPARTMARALGVPRDALPRVAAWVDDFVGCIAPGSAPARVARGKSAAEPLLRALGAAGDAGEAADAAATRVGLLVQTHDATAGLIGNALVALGRAPSSLLVEVDALVEKVLREDPPVQNTRRFVVRGGLVAGRAMVEGDRILLVVAAAQRDAAREGLLAFGAGAHACPGAARARAIAAGALRGLLASGVTPATLLDGLAYRPSANTRVPIFESRRPDPGFKAMPFT